MRSEAGVRERGPEEPTTETPQRRAHHRLIAWQEGIHLVKLVYRVTGTFPKEEMFGLTGQLRRAAVSVPSNIAEGASRRSKKEFVNFLSMARGSLSEIDTQIRIAIQIGYMQDSQEIDSLIDRLFGLIGGLIASLRRSDK